MGLCVVAQRKTTFIQFSAIYPDLGNTTLRAYSRQENGDGIGMETIGKWALLESYIKQNLLTICIIIILIPT